MTKFSPGFGMRRPWLVLMNRIVGGWVGSDGAGATPPAPAARRSGATRGVAEPVAPELPP